MRYRYWLVALLFGFCLWLSAEKGPAAEKHLIRVGIYQNRPKVFWDRDGRPQGIFIDIIEEIAAREGWRLKYIKDDWHRHLSSLEKGEIDILVDVTFSEERARRFAFNKIPLFESWLQAYVYQPLAIEKVTDLDGCRVAVLKGAIQEDFLRELKEKYDINVTIVAGDDYPATIKALRQGEAEVLLASRFFSFSQERPADIRPSYLVLRPRPVHFAFSPKTEPALIDAVDKQLAAMKNDVGSAYYRSLNYWLGMPPRRYVPLYFKVLLASAVIAVIVLVLLWLISHWRLMGKAKIELEQKVKERTAQLEELNRELQAFTYSVSHDLRVPLRAIDGFSGILLEDYGDKFDNEGRRLINIVRENTARMGRLIDDLLSYSRISQRSMALNRVDMKRLMEETVAEVAQGYGERKVKVVIGELPPAWGDHLLLRQVFLNLVSNSFKFTRDRDPAEISIGFVPEDGGWYYVRDNGMGFDMKYRDKLFVIFQRLHSQQEFEGTGVGLAIVQRVVQKHGGRLRAEAEPGRGAVFYVQLPLWT